MANNSILEEGMFEIKIEDHSYKMLSTAKLVQQIIKVYKSTLVRNFLRIFFLILDNLSYNLSQTSYFKRKMSCTFF